MNDFKLMAHILSAIKVCENEGRVESALFDPIVLKTTERERDAMIIRLQKEEYIDGFYIVDDIDNQNYPEILWSASHPSITIKGISFIQENKPLRKAIEELKGMILSAASGKISNMLMVL